MTSKPIEKYFETLNGWDVYQYGNQFKWVLKDRHDKHVIVEIYTKAKSISNLHRLDGPARVCPGGEKEYWIDGKRLTEDEFKALTNIKDLKDRETSAELGNI